MSSSSRAGSSYHSSPRVYNSIPRQYQVHHGIVPAPSRSRNPYRHQMHAMILSARPPKQRMPSYTTTYGYTSTTTTTSTTSTTQGYTVSYTLGSTYPRHRHKGSHGRGRRPSWPHHGHGMAWARPTSTRRPTTTILPSVNQSKMTEITLQFSNLLKSSLFQQHMTETKSGDQIIQTIEFELPPQIKMEFTLNANGEIQKICLANALFNHDIARQLFKRDLAAKLTGLNHLEKAILSCP